MAERALPTYTEMETVLAHPVKGLEGAALSELVHAKLAAEAEIKTWRPWLFPEDDDG